MGKAADEMSSAMHRRGRRLALACLVWVVAGACSREVETAPAAVAAPEPVAAETDAPSASPIDPEAVEIARRAGDFLRDAQRFGFSAETGYEVVQEDGAKLEFGSARRYLVARPDRVRVESEPREGARRLAFFDGRTFVQADLEENVFARADLRKPRDIDFLIDLLRDRLDAPVPLAELLRNDPRAAIEDSLEAAAWIGAERLRGVDCDHLALRNPDADLQLWIARGPEPVLRRVVITYRNEEGRPSFWADLDDWSFAPEFSDASFRFEPPAGAERVRFEVLPASQSAAEASP
jgi:hypothetical protein